MAGGDECRWDRISPAGAIRPGQTLMMQDIPIIYVIDDEEQVRHALEEMLTVFGYTVAVHDTAVETRVAHGAGILRL